MKKQGYVQCVICLCQITGRSRKLENKKQGKIATQSRMKQYWQCKKKVKQYNLKGKI